MHIVSTADDAFVPHFGAMLHSAWLFHPDAKYTLLALGVTEDNLSLLREFARKRCIALEIIEVDAGRTDGLPIKWAFTTATYLRLFIPEFLPASIGRAIYLDADITLNGRLDELFDLDMQGKPLGAVTDSVKIRDIERAIHGLDETSTYFNVGVLLYDLTRWRQEKIAEQILSFARTTTAELFLMDQSAINVVLQGRILPLERTFNAYFENFDLVSDPVVIHYAGPDKPWKTKRSEFHDLYRFHRSRTPWPLFVEPDRRSIKERRRQFAAWLGVPRYRMMAMEARKLELTEKRIAAPALERAHSLLARTEIAG